MKRKKNKEDIYIIAAIIVIIIAVIILIIIQNTKNDDEEKIYMNTISVNQVEEHSDELENEKYQRYMDRLKNGTERERIEAYAGKFFKLIEDKEYEEAYDLLADSFKNNYFRDIERFKEYIKVELPSRLITLKYNNIERNGNLYVLEVEIINPVTSEGTQNHLSKYIVIEEYGFDDFKLSFSV